MFTSVQIFAQHFPFNTTSKKAERTKTAITQIASTKIASIKNSKH